ncbi:MAG: hypothetical protein ACI865_000256 [Flavobacteriaceae bacterium]|jgi:hypothetical protein
MKKFLFILFFPISAFGQNTVCFTIEANPNPTDPALSSFTKYVNVLDCFEIYGEPTISDAKVLHAAAVAAELLDNDEDGIVDDLLIKDELANSSALMPLFSSEGSAAETAFDSNYTGNGVSAVLYNNEIDPTQTGYWGADATVEEVLHTINHVGHTNVYPSAFSMSANSSLMSAAMDSARGGQFLTIPSPYPASAWYHYDDVTCDYECMAIEYIYWSIVSNMGILDDAATCSGIANEWEPCSPSLFQSIDVLMYALITDPQYKLPQIAPDGNYCPSNVGVNSIPSTKSLIYPNPASDTFNYISSSNSFLKIIGLNGAIISEASLSIGNNNINVSTIDNGLYLVMAEGQAQRIQVKH